MESIQDHIDTVTNTIQNVVVNCRATLHLRAENLPNTDLIGKSDPYYLVFYNDKLVYTSEIIKNSLNVEWEPAVFEMPWQACMREIRIKIMDKDTIGNDDLMLDFEIRYPFRQNNYAFPGDCKICVLNDDGEIDEGEATSGSEVEDDSTLDLVKKVGKFGFKLRELGKKFNKD